MGSFWQHTDHAEGGGGRTGDAHTHETRQLCTQQQQGGKHAQSIRRPQASFGQASHDKARNRHPRQGGRDGHRASFSSFVRFVLSTICLARTQHSKNTKHRFVKIRRYLLEAVHGKERTQNVEITHLCQTRLWLWGGGGARTKNIRGKREGRATRRRP